MKYTVASSNVKVLGKAIHSLAKIGEELYIEALKTTLILRTITSSRSAYASFSIAAAFFVTLCEDIPVKCKISLKSCLLAFKSLATLEKSVDTCCFNLSPGEDKLILKFHCKYDVVKTYHIPFIECETLQALFHTQDCQNVIAAQSRLLADGVQNFSSCVEEVTLIASQERVLLRNYVDDEPDPLKIVHTEVSLDADEFEDYDVILETDVTFCLKELRAMLSFSEGCNVPVTIHFQKGGRPIAFRIKDVPNIEAEFLFATLSEQGQVSGSTAKVSTAVQENKLALPTKDTNRNQGPLQQENGTTPHSSQLNTIKRSTLCTEIIPLHSVTEENLNGQSDQPTKVSSNNEAKTVMMQSENSVSDQDIIASATAFFEEEEDVIPSTPPIKKFRSAFLGLSQTTEYTSMAPDPDEILVEASDDDEF